MDGNRRRDMPLSCRIEGESDGRDVVLLHGWGCDSRFLEKQGRHLAPEFRVIAPDLPGHGRSAAIADPTVPALADAVVALLHRIGSGNAIVIGHSLGGTIALELRNRFPHLVRQAIMIDTVLWPNPDLKAAIRSTDDLLRAHRFDEARAATEAALFLPSDGEEVRDLFRSSFKATDGQTLIDTFAAHLIDYHPSPADDVEDRPMGYIGADHPLASESDLAAHFPGVTIEKVTGSGHFIPLICPDRVNAAIRRVMARAPRERRSAPA